jgi:hypothetical protein
MRSKIFNLLPIVAIVAASACTTATPYRPASDSYGEERRTGYWDYRIEADRYRVTFGGNSMTSRETVERYLLFRSAELTLERGYDWFVMADRDTERKSRTYIDQPFSPGRFGYWGPTWSYWSPGFGRRQWDPYWGDPFWDRSIDVRTVERYEASAEIVLGRGRKPDNPRAFDARDVIENLRQSIILPR